MSISFSQNSLIFNNQEYRCPKCFLVPFINISFNENKLFMSTKCINNHTYSKPFDEMQKMSKIGINSKFNCDICLNESNENKNNFSNIYYYCSNCYKFFCLKHGEIHNLKEKHNILINQKLDSICIEHQQTNVVGYCKNHNKNYCLKCNHFKENNNLIDEGINDNQIKYYENKMKKNEEILKEIELLFDNYKKIFKEVEYNFSIYKDNINKKIKFMNEIIIFYKNKKNENNINYQMKANIENNYFDLTQIKQNITNNLNTQTINDLLIFLKKNEIKNKSNIIKEEEKFNNFKFENMINFKTLDNNQGTITCLKILDDGRLSAGDSKSNLIIYNIETFKPDIIIKNNLGYLWNFTQLKNKNLICSFNNNNTFKIIKIKNKNEYENIQIFQNAHQNSISKIIELKNENIITFSYDCSFKIWKLNSNNKYEKINEFKDTNMLSDGIEIKDNEILYSLDTNPNSLVFFNINKYNKIETLFNLKLCCYIIGNRIIKLNSDEVIIAGDKLIYLLDINNYLVLNEIYSDYCNFCILKLSNDSFLIGDEKGIITQYKNKNKKLIKESQKKNSHKERIYSITKFNDMIISGGFKSNEIKFWIK